MDTSFPCDTVHNTRTGGHGGADAGEDEEEGEDGLGEHGADAAGLGELAVVPESKLRHEHVYASGCLCQCGLSVVAR
jgi:hypothetical protein